MLIENTPMSANFLCGFWWAIRVFFFKPLLGYRLKSHGFFTLHSFGDRFFLFTNKNLGYLWIL
ncbi:hypothetical protein [Candidatus Desulfovibrio trichonymphae]|uniref:hypothetical protein n=1 Tax=Candidatus Desulfovibrio trichonymphae TaxID=1725232 RepID=UPI000BBA8209|nr:hypothetical protein [Candidatus Desulfovibrio trichonymphae]